MQIPQCGNELPAVRRSGDITRRTHNTVTAHAVLVDLDTKTGTVERIGVALAGRQRLGVTSSRRAPCVSVKPQAMFGMTQATCSAAAQATLDSPVLQEMLTLMPSVSQSCAACVSARAPPSLIAFRLTPRAAFFRGAA